MTKTPKPSANCKKTHKTKPRLKKKRTVVTIGNFDGLHIGHQHIIRQVLKKAHALKARSVLYTFNPHPAEILKPRQPLKRLCTGSQHLRLLKQTGLNDIIVQPFTRAFSRLTPEHFIKQYIVKTLSPLLVVVGDNFLFGARGKGDHQLLKTLGQKYGFKVQITAPLKKNGEVVSSTRIRQMITAGQLHLIPKLLGRAFLLTAKAVKGCGRGTKLGFPTINLQADKNQILPLNGVYSAKFLTHGGKKKPAVVNIGGRPTFNKALGERPVVIEVHLINARINWQQSMCEVEIIKRIRSEKKFPHAEALTTQIKKDIQKAKKDF